MEFFRQYIAPFLVVLVFLMALAAVSARIFLPSDMLAPAPAEEADSVTGFPLSNAPTLAFTGLRSQV
ncbi:MAG: hypothetical protein BRC43_14620 [Cyanobacteria bacterium QS_3_48_167]|nr:MAG: hypothetical protein BRC43_14620 [Cyanobacteria bacterium QS_3_48_167]